MSQGHGRRQIMRGDLAITGFTELMQLLAMGLKAGRLTVSSGEMAASVYLVDGAVAHATVSTRRLRLGDLLVGRGLVSRGVLETSIIAARARGMRIGEYLVREGVVTEAAIAAAVRQQVELAVFDCCALESGTYTFDPNAQPDADELAGMSRPMAVDILLLEGARRVDEWRVIAQSVPAFDVVFALDRERVEASRAPMSETVRFVLGLIDGQRDVRAMVAASGFDEFTVAHALHVVVSAGFARAVDRTRPHSTHTADAIDEHRFLGLTFARGKMYHEAEREYRQVVHAHPDDRAALCALGVLALRKGKVADAIRWLESAAAGAGLLTLPAAAGAAPVVVSGGPPMSPRARGTLLYTLALAYERDGRLQTAADLLAGLTEGPASPWLVPYLRGRIALRLGDYAAALKHLEALGAGDNRNLPVAWWHDTALAHALHGDVARAAELAKLGTAVHPKSPRLYALLAVCADRRGAFDEARMWAERGLRESRDHAPCLKNLADAYYRLRNFPQARRAYETLVRRPDGARADAWFKLGNILMQSGEPARAQDAWRRALEIDPAHQTARSNLEVLGAAGGPTVPASSGMVPAAAVAVSVPVAMPEVPVTPATPPAPTPVPLPSKLTPQEIEQNLAQETSVDEIVFDVY